MPDGTPAGKLGKGDIKRVVIETLFVALAAGATHVTANVVPQIGQESLGGFALVIGLTAGISILHKWLSNTLPK